jgi:hypothetical protein
MADKKKRVAPEGEVYIAKSIHVPEPVAPPAEDFSGDGAVTWTVESDADAFVAVDPRTALDLRRRELDGSVGPVSTAADLDEQLLAIDREAVALNKARQDADTKLKATRA